MRSLVAEWVHGGDEMCHSIWSDLWKDEYGMRPRYTKEEALEVWRYAERHYTDGMEK